LTPVGNSPWRLDLAGQYDEGMNEQPLPPNHIWIPVPFGGGVSYVGLPVWLAIVASVAVLTLAALAIVFIGASIYGKRSSHSH
jgi:hypothetical protein